MLLDLYGFAVGQSVISQSLFVKTPMCESVKDRYYEEFYWCVLLESYKWS